MFRDGYSELVIGFGHKEAGGDLAYSFFGVEQTKTWLEWAWKRIIGEEEKILINISINETNRGPANVNRHAKDLRYKEGEIGPYPPRTHNEVGELENNNW